MTALAPPPPSPHRAPRSPQLHDAGDVPRGEDPPDVVEVPDEDAAVGSAGQRERRQELVALRLPVTAGAGDAAAPAVSWGTATSRWVFINMATVHFYVFPPIYESNVQLWTCLVKKMLSFLYISKNSENCLNIFASFKDLRPFKQTQAAIHCATTQFYNNHHHRVCARSHP